MNTLIRSVFPDKRQYRLFLLLCLATLFNFALIAIRMRQTGIYLSDITHPDDYLRLRGTPTFLFLVWNLFLAWIPYLISLFIDRIHHQYRSVPATACVLFAWLMFLPNAPYILTDLLHLKSRSPIPLWYDMMLILSFAWTGLMLGFVSLYRVQAFLSRRMDQRAGWILTIIVIGLTGFGVYLGRFLRWNSWDVLNNPLDLGRDIATILLNPVQFSGPLTISALISVFLLLGYLHLVALIKEQ